MLEKLWIIRKGEKGDSQLCPLAWASSSVMGKGGI